MVGAISERVRGDAKNAWTCWKASAASLSTRSAIAAAGHYRSVVVDHDTGRLRRVGVGRDEKTLAAFFNVLGPERYAEITLVSTDAGSWIAKAVEQYCPNTVRCMDPLHVVSWATDALDQLGREV